MANFERATLQTEDVRRIAALAGLPLTDDRIEAVTKEMRGLLSLAASLYELDTSDVDPEMAWDASWD